MSKVYTIGDAAAKLGMPASTIRFYEKNGLIPNQQRASWSYMLDNTNYNLERLNGGK